MVKTYQSQVNENHADVFAANPAWRCEVPAKMDDREKNRTPRLRSRVFPICPRNVGVIKIYGSEDFVLRVSTALEALKGFYPFGYSLVQRYIHSVIESDVDPQIGILTGVLYEPTTRGSPFAAGPARYAAYLVRRAVGERQSVGSAVRSSSRALAAIL